MSHRNTTPMRAASQEYVVECGGPPDAMRGWSATAESRRDGSTAGHQDVYYFNANNKRFRSRVEVGAERGSVAVHWLLPRQRS